MRLGLFTVLALLIGATATHFLMENNGYVLINFSGYTVEMSIPVLLFFMVLCYVAVRLLVRIWQAPRHLGEIAAHVKIERSRRRITQGFIALSEGKLARGERLLTKGATNSETPLLNYLAAARTAQMQGDRERRNGWLKMAYEQNTKSRNAVLLVQAELQLADGEYEQARASLGRVREQHPGHPQALKLLGELHHRDQNWDALSELLPELRNIKNMPAQQLDAWTIEAYAKLLSAKDIDRERIEALWQRLPRPLRKSLPLVRARVKALAACGEYALADFDIRKTLKSDWDDELVNLYGELNLTDPDTQLRQAEIWLNKRPEDACLLLTAGRVCIRNQLWGKARSYIESSLAIRPTPAAYQLIGQLMLKLDEPQAATTAFAKGLTLSNYGMSDVPQLERKNGV